MRLGLWNALRGREPRDVAAIAASIIREHDLDALAVTEAQQYVRAFSRLPGLRVVAFCEHPGQANTALLVRVPVKVSGMHTRRMTWHGWITVRGSRTPAKWLTSAVVGRVRVAVVHLPPSQRWRGDAMTGPVRRVAATIVHMRRLRSWLGKRRRPTIVVGDFNATPGTRGRWSPAWVAENTRSRIVAPDQPTHGRRVIDYAIARNLTATATTRGKYGSDHHLVTFEIQEP